MRILILCVLLAWVLALNARGQQPSSGAAFDVVPLGVKGGLAEGNLSAYLVAAAGSNNYVCLDAGSLRVGIEKAVDSRIFSVPADEVLKQYIKAYCISHAHLDHVAGLLLNAPDDVPKPIYGLPACLATIQNDYFNWQAWPNFGSGGTPPALHKYQLRELLLHQETIVDNTTLSVQPFVLSHGNAYQSAAFLLRSNDSYLLYLGDTGTDEIEKSHCLRDLWQAIQPLVQQHKLKAIFMEASYANAQPTEQLFGHLTPALLMEELAALAQLTGAAAVRDLPVIITHIKPTPGNESAIRRQLAAANLLHLKLVFPEQGQRLQF